MTASALDLQDLANIGQVIGAVAVVLSLFYVGFQIRQNTAAVRSSTAQAVHDNYANWYNGLSQNRETNRIAVKGLKDYASLDETEKAQFICVFMAFTSYSQNAFYQWREGSLSPQLWVGWESLIFNLVGSPGGKEFWKERGYIFGSEFRDYVTYTIMAREPHPEAKPFGAFRIGEGS